MSGPIDTAAAARHVLAENHGVAALCGSRIWVGTGTPPGYDPSGDGAGVQLFVRGGGEDTDLPLSRPSFQLRCWAATPEAAWTAYAAAATALEDGLPISTPYGAIVAAREEQAGQLVVDPATGWVSVLSFHALMVRAA